MLDLLVLRLVGVRVTPVAEEAAWRAFEARLGNLTADEEARVAGAWRSGWSACLAALQADRDRAWRDGAEAAARLLDEQQHWHFKQGLFVGASKMESLAKAVRALPPPPAQPEPKA